MLFIFVKTQIEFMRYRLFTQFSTRLLLAILIINSTACSSGKRMFEKGDYDGAVMQASQRLKLSPNNAKAKSTLKNAYTMALKTHLDAIQQADNYKTENYYDIVLSNYTALYNLEQTIKFCPACLNVVSNLYEVAVKLTQTKKEALEFYYKRGNDYLTLGGKENARKALIDFNKVVSIQYDYRDIGTQVNQAKWEASEKIIIRHIPMHSRTFSISNEFFEKKILEYCYNTIQVNRLVQFLTPEEAKREHVDNPDQIIDIYFDDFIVGQTYVKENNQEFKKDSVIIGTTTINGKEQSVYGSVKASVRSFEKSVLSSGLLNLSISSPNSNSTLLTEKIPGSYTWVCKWGNYNGDNRALSKDQINMCQGKELMPPMPQDLFIEFTKPIYSQLTSRLNSFYNSYK
jgi:tetratricopeptide (TPR) repeat protein